MHFTNCRDKASTSSTPANEASKSVEKENETDPDESDTDGGYVNVDRDNVRCSTTIPAEDMRSSCYYEVVTH